jgi:membrane-bound serine protease (ClpP class)
MTAPAESKSMGVNVGDVGDVVSRLRPIGRAQFGAAVVDVVAEGAFLDVGTTVEIINIRGNRVVVKAVEEES